METATTVRFAGAAHAPSSRAPTERHAMCKRSSYARRKSTC